MREAVCWEPGTEETWEIPMPSTHLCCELKTASTRMKSFFKKNQHRISASNSFIHQAPLSPQGLSQLSAGGSGCLPGGWPLLCDTGQ